MTTTAWFVDVVVRHQPRRTICNSFINAIQQQQQKYKERSRTVVLRSSKADDTTTTTTTILESTATGTSETSIKIRALASFISMNMLEAMLAAGIPIEKIISMTSLSSSITSDSSTSSSSSPPPPNDGDVTSTITTAPVEDIMTNEVNDEARIESDFESSKSLHHKEGDRIIAMQDTFNTDDDISPVRPIANTSTDVLQESEAPTTDGSMMSSSSITLQQQQEHLLLIPEIPSVISKAFGRPLSVIREHVPPMQQKLPPILATEMITTTTNETNDISHSNVAVGTVDSGDNNTTTTTIGTDIKVVTDEDPYGE